MVPCNTHAPINVQYNVPTWLRSLIVDKYDDENQEIDHVAGYQLIISPNGYPPDFKTVRKNTIKAFIKYKHRRETLPEDNIRKKISIKIKQQKMPHW